MEPDEIERREFSTGLRGYDRSEVDVFTKEIAQLVRRLQTDLAAVRSSLAKAKAAPPPPPPAPVPESVPDKDMAYRFLGEETTRVLIAAEHAAKEIKARANQQAAEVVADARREAGRIAREGREGRQEAQDDLRQLRQTRGMLAGQLEDIRRKLAEAVARLQTPVDPTALAHGPEKSDSRPGSRLAPTSLSSRSGPLPIRAQPRPSADPAAPKAQPSEPEPPKAQPSEPEPPKAQPSPAPNRSEEASASNGKADVSSVSEDPVERLLEEIRQESETEPSEPALPEPVQEFAETDNQPNDPDSLVLKARADILGQTTGEAARRLKRLLQEDQNDLLHRLRTQKGKGALHENIASEKEQLDRFRKPLTALLLNAFSEGRRIGGADGVGNAPRAVDALISKQVVSPLRNELCRVIDSGLTAGDTPSAISERANDVFRVWKGVRTELLGEGIVYAAFHQGVLDAFSGNRQAVKRWILSLDELQCPREICKTNAAQGSVLAEVPFLSGHVSPPAHGGCTCSLEASKDS